VKAVVEIDQGRIAVTDRGVDVFFDRRARPDADLGRLDSSRSEPPGEQVEKWTPCSTKMPPL